MDEFIDPRSLWLIRDKLGFTQTEAARAIGLSLRALQDIESGKTPARKSHHMALQLLSLQEAVRRGDETLATRVTAQYAREFAKLSAAQNTKSPAPH